MASFNDNRRGEGPKRRLDDPRRRRMSILSMERLENRRLLTGGGITPGSGGGLNWHATNSNLLDPQNGPLANLGPAAIDAYSDFLKYLNAGAKGTFTTSQSKDIYFVGDDIGMDIRGYGNFSTFEASLVSLGVVVTATSPGVNLVEGYVPIIKLPQVAEDSQTVGGEPLFKPSYFQQGASPEPGRCRP